MLRTPNQNDLPHIVREVTELSDFIPHSIEKHVLSEPAKEDVLAKLRTSNIAHFACHGVKRPVRPFPEYYTTQRLGIEPIDSGRHSRIETRIFTTDICPLVTPPAITLKSCLMKEYTSQEHFS